MGDVRSLLPAEVAIAGILAPSFWALQTRTRLRRCTAIVPARAVRAYATVSWRPPEIPEAISPMMGRRGRDARDNDTGGRR
jgi:hypothetical protein